MSTRDFWGLRLRYLRLLSEAQRMAAYVLPPGLDYKIVESLRDQAPLTSPGRP